MATKMYRAYSVIQRPKQDDYWLNIGVMFPHTKEPNSDGFNLILQALPLPDRDGQVKLVMRPYDPSEAGEVDDDDAKPKAKAKAA